MLLQECVELPMNRLRLTLLIFLLRFKQEQREHGWL